MKMLSALHGVSANLLYGFERFNLQNLENAASIMATTSSLTPVERSADHCLTPISLVGAAWSEAVTSRHEGPPRR
jgi:hypothetical protein